MQRPEFTYVIYIASSAEAVFDALTQPHATRRYWGHRNVSDWRAGSRWRHEREDGGADLMGRVIEVSRPEKLVISWGAPMDIDQEDRLSRVEFDIAQVGAYTRLTVIHSGLDERSYDGVASGWAKVLSNLKSWVERGDVVPGLI